MKDTSELVASLLADMTRQLEEGNIISIQGFGTFEVKKKAERISVNPTTKQRMLVPPKLVLTYKPSTLLMKKFKKIARDLYSYYGVTEEDIINKTERYSSLVTSLSS